MRKIATAAAMAVAMAFAGTAHADGNDNGKWQIKLLGTAVLPDGKVSAVKVDPLGLTSGDPLSVGAAGSVDVGNTTANDNYVPTVAIEYFFTPNISLETICCVTGHHVSISAGNLTGVGVLDNVQIIPATFTAKYHLTGLPMGIKPYIGAGPSLFIMLNDRPSATLVGKGASRSKLSSDVGVAVQAGFDIPLTKGYGLSVDAKKYWVSTTATIYDPAAPNGILLQTRNKLDPWVVSAGVTYRF